MVRFTALLVKLTTLVSRKKLFLLKQLVASIAFGYKCIVQTHA